jgi:hypothetical protein
MTITLTREEAQQILWGLDPTSCSLLKEFIGWRAIASTLRARLSAPELEPTEIETLKQCLFQMQEASKEQTKAFDRLVRIMGTFDLATGHADGWNDLLDSLESELRDILGHYREALNARQEPEPVAGYRWEEGRIPPSVTFTAPPQREWQGLTYEEVDALHYFMNSKWSTRDLVRCVEAKLREKNT